MDCMKLVKKHVTGKIYDLEGVARYVIAAVCEEYNILPADLLEDTREMHVVEPRWMAWVFIKLFEPEYRLKELAAMFGLRDHTTVINGLKKMRYWVTVRATEGERYNRIREQLLVVLAAEVLTENKKHEVRWECKDWQRHALLLEWKVKEMERKMNCTSINN